MPFCINFILKYSYGPSRKDIMHTYYINECEYVVISYSHILI